MKRIEQGLIMMRMQILKPILLVNTMIAIAASQSQIFLAAIHLSSSQTYYYSLAQIHVFSYVFTTLCTMQFNTVLKLKILNTRSIRMISIVVLLLLITVWRRRIFISITPIPILIISWIITMSMAELRIYVRRWRW